MGLQFMDPQVMILVIMDSTGVVPSEASIAMPLLLLILMTIATTGTLLPSRHTLTTRTKATPPVATMITTLLTQSTVVLLTRTRRMSME
jgi:hypothetical protein